MTTKLKSHGGSRREEFLLSRAFYIDSKQIERIRPIVCSSIRRIVIHSASSDLLEGKHREIKELTPNGKHQFVPRDQVLP